MTTMILTESQLREHIKTLVNEKIRSFKNTPGHRQRVKSYSKFSIGELKQVINAKESLIEQIDACWEYCASRLQSIGAGSSREAFVLTGRYVIKVVRPTGRWQAGLAQNEHEVLVNKTSPKVQQIIPKIGDYNENFIWVIAETVKPMEDHDVINFFGMRIVTLCHILDDLRGNTRRRERPREMPNDTESVIKFYKHYIQGGSSIYVKPEIVQTIDALVEFIVTNDLPVQDVVYQFAKTSEGRLVVYDYGLSDDIWKLYY